LRAAELHPPVIAEVIDDIQLGTPALTLLEAAEEAWSQAMPWVVPRVRQIMRTHDAPSSRLLTQQQTDLPAEARRQRLANTSGLAAYARSSAWQRQGARRACGGLPRWAPHPRSPR